LQSNAFKTFLGLETYVVTIAITFWVSVIAMAVVVCLYK
jgi:hypothetical protein